MPDPQGFFFPTPPAGPPAVAPPVSAAPPAAPSAAPTTLRDYLVQQAAQYKVDPRFALAILNRESSGGVHTQQGQVLTSPQGARGMFQVLPETAKAYGLNPDDPFDNIQAGVRNLREALDHTGGDVEAAARYYHGGSDLRQHGPLTRAYGRAVAAELRGALEAEANQPPPAPPSGTQNSAEPGLEPSWTGLGANLPDRTAPPSEPSQLWGLAAEATRSVQPVWDAIKAIPKIPEYAQQLPGLVQRAYQDPSGTADAAWQGIKRVGAGIQQTQTDLWNQGTAMEDESARMSAPDNPNRDAQSQAAYLRGLEGRMRKSAAMIPLLGPIAAKAQDFYGTGEWGRGTGSLIDLGIQSSFLKGPKRAGLTVPAVFPQKLNPLQKSAVDAAQAAGIPMDVATASGNRVALTLQKASEMTYFGSERAQDIALRRGEAIPQWGDDIATQVHPRAATPLSAGEDVKAGVQAYIDRGHALADSAYDRFRAIEADPANTRTVQVGMKQQKNAQGVLVSVPDMRPMQLPVDLRTAKQALRPLYARLTRQMDVTRQAASPGLHVIRQILEGPDFAPASVVDADLGTIKSLARTTDEAGLRTMSQGVASQGVKALTDAVDTAVASAGPQAQWALEIGRTATRAKHAAADVLRALASGKAEDYSAYRQLVQPGDASVGFLEQVQKLAPREIPKVGRAVLEEIFAASKEEGGWGRGAGAFQKWKRLGPETKALLYKPEHVQALDDFFLAAKMLEKNPNPSMSTMSGVALGSLYAAAQHPAVGLPALVAAGRFTQLMNSPLGVRLLTTGLTISPGTAKAAAWTAAAERLLKEEGERADARGAPPPFPPGPIRSVVGPPPTPPR